MKTELFRMAGEFLKQEQAREDRRMLMLKLLKGVFVALALGMAFLAGKATAAPLIHPTSLQELFVAAIQFGGYEEKCQARGGCPMPAVVIVSIEDDNIAGQFDPRQPNFVKVNTTPSVVPGSLFFNAVLVHEFTHYLQWLFGDLGPFSRCRDRPKIEEQAYRAGAEYLGTFGIVYDYSDQLIELEMMAALCEASGGM